MEHTSSDSRIDLSDGSGAIGCFLLFFALMLIFPAVLWLMFKLFTSFNGSGPSSATLKDPLHI